MTDSALALKIVSLIQFWSSKQKLESIFINSANIVILKKGVGNLTYDAQSVLAISF